MKTKLYITNLILSLFIVDSFSIDSTYVKNIGKCHDIVLHSHLNDFIIPIPMIKDSIVGILFITLEDFSKSIDQSDSMALVYIDSFYKRNKLFNFNFLKIKKFFYFMVSSEITDSVEFESDECLVRQKNKFYILRNNGKPKFSYLINPTCSNTEKFYVIWREFLNGHFYFFNPCDGIYCRYNLRYVYGFKKKY